MYIDTVSRENTSHHFTYNFDTSRRPESSHSSTTAERLQKLQQFFDSDPFGPEEIEASDSSIITGPTLEKPAPDPRDIHTADTILCAISESRSADVIGMATLNLTTGAADIVRIVNDDKFEYQRLISVLSSMEEQPTCFILLQTRVRQSSLMDSLLGTFPHKNIKGLDRKYWSATEGLRLVRKLALEGEREAILAALDKNFYASCAFAAVVTYASQDLNFDLAPGCVHIKYSHPADTLRLDHVSVTALELLQAAREGGSRSSNLFGIMDRTHTPQGRRLLRSALLQPSTHREEITMRQEAVEEFVAKEEFRSDVCKCLKALHRIDVERVVSWILRGDSNPDYPLALGRVYSRAGVELACHEYLREAEGDLNFILMLKEYLEGVVSLHGTLATEGCSSGLSQWLEGQLAPARLSGIKELLATHIDENARFRTKPIEAPPNSSLEKARLSYKEATDAMDEYVDGLNAVLGEYLGKEGKLYQDSDHRYSLSFPTSDVTRALGWAMQSGLESQFEFQLPAQWGDRMPGQNPIFIATRKPNCYVFHSREFFEHSQRTQLYADIVTSGSDSQAMHFKRLLRAFDLAPLYEMSDAVAVLDLGAKNPIVEIRRPDFTPNDVYFGVNSHRCLVLTGGNMSGKSTFVKMVALIQIMTQMGFFVPAAYVDVPICDQIFTRLSTEDNPENNLGTFAVEMSDMNLILRHAAANSLVIIDELSRGTSHHDGLSLALSMCRHLLKVNARTVFATHFNEICPFLRAENQEKFTCAHFASDNVFDQYQVREVNISHHLRPGPIQYQDYGVDLARRFLPQTVVDVAEQVSGFLRGKTQTHATPRPAAPATMRSRLVTGVSEVLHKLYDASQGDSSASLAIELKKLQDAARDMEEGVAGITISPPSALANVPASKHPMSLSGLSNLLSRASTGPTEERRRRWAQEEHRVMAVNTDVPPGTKRSNGIEKGASSDEVERPRKVVRGSAGSSRDTLTELAELTQQLDEARSRLREWEREDGF
ncbi:MutS domain V domain containing protein [Rhypophila decipiens]